MGLHSTSLYILFLIIVIQASVRLAISTCVPKEMDTCTGEKPLFCAHHCMCYGPGEYCSKEESKIQDCLPSDDAEALRICIEKGYNVSAITSAQCSMACFHRFPDYEPRPEGSGDKGLMISVIVLGSLLPAALLALGIFIWKFYVLRKELRRERKERKEITVEKMEIDNKEADGGRDVETGGQVFDVRAIRQLSQEVAEPDPEDTSSEETSLMCATTTTELQQGRHPNISSNGLGTSEMPRSCREEITGGTQCAEGRFAEGESVVGDSNIQRNRTVQRGSASNPTGSFCEQFVQMPAEQRSLGLCVPTGARA